MALFPARSPIACSPRYFFLFLFLFLIATPLHAAPEFAASGRAPELEKVILAQSPMGPITALDVLMYDDMNEQILWDVPIDALVDPKSLAAEKYTTRIRKRIEAIAAAHALAQRAGAWQPPADEVRIKTHGAVEAAWIEQNVKPHVKVEPVDVDRYYLAHATDYLRRRQVQVRYIFRSVDLNAAAVAQRAHDQLQRVAAEVRQKTRTFEAAAREESDARSAADGGLLPPFYDQTYFPAFEQQAFALDTPGQITDVFEGPGGLYLVQLVATYPVRNIPIEDVRGELAEELRHDHVRHYFNYAYGRLIERIYGRNFSFWWPYLDADAPIATVGKSRLSRQDFMRYYGNPTDDKFEVRWDVVSRGAVRWMEGETIMRDMEQTGQSLNHPWIQRAAELAKISLRARRTLAAEISPAALADVDSSLETLKHNSEFLPGFKSYHLVGITIEPLRDRDMTAEDKRRSAHLAEFVEEQLRAGKLPTEPLPMDFAEWRKKALASPRSIEDSIKEIDEAIAATQWQDIRIKISDAGWNSPLPNSAMARLLAGVDDGELSRTEEIGDRHTLYMILESKTPSVEMLKVEPLGVRVLAFQAESERLRAAESKKLLDQGAITYQF